MDGLDQTVRQNEIEKWELVDTLMKLHSNIQVKFGKLSHAVK